MKITSMTIEGAQRTLTIAVEGDGTVRVRDGQRVVDELGPRTDPDRCAAALHQLAEGFRGTAGDTAPYTAALAAFLQP
jgi:hypothetical protein